MEPGVRETTLSMLQDYLCRLTGRLSSPGKNTFLGYYWFCIERTYSMLEDEENTMEFLEKLKSIPHVDLQFVNELKNWPSYDLVRETRQFREIINTLETRCREEHDRITVLLRTHDLIQ